MLPCGLETHPAADPLRKPNPFHEVVLLEEWHAVPDTFEWAASPELASHEQCIDAPPGPLPSVDGHQLHERVHRGERRVFLVSHGNLYKPISRLSLLVRYGVDGEQAIGERELQHVQARGRRRPSE